MPPNVHTPARSALRALANSQNGTTRNAGRTCVVCAGHPERVSITAPRHVRLLSTSRPATLSNSSPKSLRKIQTMAPSIQAFQARKATTVSHPNNIYEAVVVGAGPAGITAVGNLLDARIDRILWVDDAFDGGRVNKYYREVPSNTKVKLFVDFATAVSPFRKIVSNVPSRDRWEEPSASDGVPIDSKQDKLQPMRQLDQETGCFLAHPAEMCVMLTQGLKKTPGVITQKGKVSAATLDEQSSLWSINISTDSNTPQDITTAQAKRILLCTGSSPVDPPLPYEPQGLKHLHLDTALSPTKLAALLPASSTPTTIAVIGASHSAVLVLRNLSDLALSHDTPNLHIKWFTRHPLRYAEYEDGFIARDNTGLKGEAAVWARENLEPETLPSSAISKVLTKIAYEKGAEKAVYEEHLPGVEYVVQAIGYTRDPLPTLRLSSSPGKEITPYFDHDKGIFNYVRESSCGKIGDLARLPGVYGAGIAFPERVVDRKYGHEEFNVGFFKFMKAAKKWVEEWKAVPGTS